MAEFVAPKKYVSEGRCFVLDIPEDHWTLQWKGLNLYSRVRVLKIASFEGSGYLGDMFTYNASTTRKSEGVW